MAHPLGPCAKCTTGTRQAAEEEAKEAARKKAERKKKKAADRQKRLQKSKMSFALEEDEEEPVGLCRNILKRWRMAMEGWPHVGAEGSEPFVF